MGEMCSHLRTSARSVRVLLRRLRFQDEGAELFEFALVMPLLLTFLMGIIWFARAYNTYQTITRAAREGARVAVAPACWTCGSPAGADFFTAPGGCGATDPVDLAIYNSLLASNVSDACTAVTISVQQHKKQGSLANPPAGGIDPNNPNAEWTIVSITYNFKFNLPFTPWNVSTINLISNVQMVEEI